MAMHGHSGLNRFLLGSFAEKVLRGTANPLLLVRATKEAKSAGETTLKSIIVPLDGSELAESVLPIVAGLAKKLDLEIELFRAYHIPYNVYAGDEGYYAGNFKERSILTLKTGITQQGGDQRSLMKVADYRKGGDRNGGPKLRSDGLQLQS